MVLKIQRLRKGGVGARQHRMKDPVAEEPTRSAAKETAMSAAQRTVLKEAGVMRVRNRTVIVGRALRRKLRSDRLSYISIVLQFANVSLRDIRELFLAISLFLCAEAKEGIHVEEPFCSSVDLSRRPMLRP